jgi:hypothetical protein
MSKIVGLFFVLNCTLLYILYIIIQFVIYVYIIFLIEKNIVILHIHILNTTWLSEMIRREELKGRGHLTWRPPEDSSLRFLLRYRVGK